MLVPIKMANFLAKYSCSKWNSFRLLRVFCRYGYRSLAESPYIDYGPYVSCGNVRNTYPWPYRDEEFAAWREEKGALVSDPSRMVVKYSASYCAWKIRELTGHWPTKPVIPKGPEHAAEIARRERPHDAKYWNEFLEAQCYWQTSPYLYDGRHYIGIDPNFGEYGIVVWFEHLCDESTHAIVSTYVDKKFWCGKVHVDNFTWFEII